MTREQHLQRCKDRANEYLVKGDLANAVTSMLSDLEKHEETRAVGNNNTLSLLGMHYVMQHDREGVKRWVEGFR
jgi:hypothetical protein